MSRDGNLDSDDLEAFARAASVMPAPGDESESATNLLLVRIGSRWFAVDASAVREVVMKSRVTRVPTAPRHVLGVALVQGRLVPVVAFEGLFGSLPTGDAAATLPRLVVLSAAGVELALVADETRGVIQRPRLNASERARPGGERAWIAGEFEWKGLLIGVIDADALSRVAGGGEGRP